MKSNFWIRLPWWLMALGWWGMLAVVVSKVDPEVIVDLIIPHTFAPVMLLVFLAAANTVALTRHNFIKGIVWGLAIAICLELRVIGMGNYLNLLLIFGLLVTMEYYWHTSKPTKTSTSTN